MGKIIYRLLHCTWCLPQTLLGFMVFLCNRKAKHFCYHGAVVTQWDAKSSVSLGMFVFVTDEPYFYDKLKDEYTMQELSDRLLVHEYGHTIQSLILGPLYLILMGIPSTLWGFLPSLNKKRKEERISYFAFFTESWANALGEMVTGRKSMEKLVID
jgi:hypothetical protein